MAVERTGMCFSLGRAHSFSTTKRNVAFSKYHVRQGENEKGGKEASKRVGSGVRLFSYKSAFDWYLGFQCKVQKLWKGWGGAFHWGARTQILVLN